MSDHSPTPWRHQPNGFANYDIMAKQGPLDVCPARAHGLADAEFIVRAANAYQPMLDALKAAYAILADESKQGGKTWTMKAIRKAIVLAETEA